MNEHFKRYNIISVENIKNIFTQYKEYNPYFDYFMSNDENFKILTQFISKLENKQDFQASDILIPDEMFQYINILLDLHNLHKIPTDKSFELSNFDNKDIKDLVEVGKKLGFAGKKIQNLASPSINHKTITFTDEEILEILLKLFSNKNNTTAKEKKLISKILEVHDPIKANLIADLKKNFEVVFYNSKLLRESYIFDIDNFNLLLTKNLAGVVSAIDLIELSKINLLTNETREILIKSSLIKNCWNFYTTTNNPTNIIKSLEVVQKADLAKICKDILNMWEHVNDSNIGSDIVNILIYLYQSNIYSSTNINLLKNIQYPHSTYNNEGFWIFSNSRISSHILYRLNRLNNFKMLTQERFYLIITHQAEDFFDKIDELDSNHLVSEENYNIIKDKKASHYQAIIKNFIILESVNLHTADNKQKIAGIFAYS